MIAIPKVKDELERSPFRGTPEWFPVHLESESVFILDQAYLDLDKAQLGEADVYHNHLGKSKKRVPDAIIADSADALADVLVTEDPKLMKRLNKISKKCRGLTYDQLLSGSSSFENNGR